MLGAKVVIRRGSKDEAEKPFWISFSDMMSALMVLFLVVMAAALLSKTHQESAEDQAALRKQREIALLLDHLKAAASKFPGVTVEGQVINFGPRATFSFNSYQLSEETALQLRSFAPEVLGIANTAEGQRWFRRVVVEGFTDQSGSYLGNLNLSLLRSQQVVCALLADTADASEVLTSVQKDQIRDLFLVGGYSSNSARESAEASRRIEWRLEFYDNPQNARSSTASGDPGKCAI